ncbi:MAG: hypothetical protein KDA59_03775 [Planctomycetales bacterium]|nr:hypothetical protein [Planctomycetales bacterium]
MPTRDDETSPIQNRRIRREARPLLWRYLDESQRDAFADVVALLSEAAAETQSESYRVRRDSRRQYLLGRNRSNNIMLLSGDRGTGKTTLLMTLQRSIFESREWDEEVGSYRRQLAQDGSATTREERSLSQYEGQVQPHMPELRRRLIWLDPLEMEALPGPTNLLVAILARVREVVARLGSGCSRTNQTSAINSILQGSPTDAALMKLTRLTTMASLAWDGNVAQRAASLDPDAYATEVMRAEGARLEINQRLGSVLDEVAESVTWADPITDPLFVLPVDDFDLNPVRCLELLRLIRAISIPRLFTLVLGDASLAQGVVNLKLAGDMAAIATVRLQADTLYETRLYSEHRSIAVHALRKLIPPGQRVKIRNMTVEEAMMFRQSRHNARTVELLNGIRIRLPDSLIGMDNATLGELLLMKPLDLFGATDSTESGTDEPDRIDAASLRQRLRESFYSGLRAFSASPRVVSDRWFGLQKLADNTRRTAKQVNREVVQMVASWLHDELEIEASLESVALANAVLTTDANGDWQLNSEAVAARPSLRHQAEIHVSHELSLVQRRGVGWQLAWNMPGATAESVAMPDAAQNVFVLLHDLSDAVTPTVADRTIDIHDAPLVAARWETVGGNSVEVPWLPAPFRTFWKYDRLSESWRRFQKLLPLSTPEIAQAWLGFGWIALNTEMVTNQPAPRFTSDFGESPSDNDWQSLLEFVTQQLQQAAPHSTNESSRRQWLRHLTLLMSPESGWLSELTLSQVYTKERKSPWTRIVGGLMETLVQPGNVVGVRELRAREAAKFFLAGQESLATRLVSPHTFLSQLQNRLGSARPWLDKILGQVEFAEASELKKRLDTIRRRQKLRTLRADDLEVLVELLSRLSAQLGASESEASWWERLTDVFRGTPPKARLDLLSQELQADLAQLEASKSSANHPINNVGDGILCPSLAEIQAWIGRLSKP